MRVRERRRWLAVLATIALEACPSGETAIVLEVQAGPTSGGLDEVLFRVRRVDVPEAEREAVAPLTGPEGKRFPLTLVLVADGPGVATFDVAIEGRHAGVVVAMGVPVSGTTRVEFVRGQVVTHRFVLNPLAPDAPKPDAGPATVTETPPASGPDGGAPIADAGVEGPPVVRPLAGPGEACGGQSACAAGLVCLGGRCCQSTCADVCLAGTCSATGACVPVQDGAPCHGNSGMTCRRGQCMKDE